MRKILVGILVGSSLALATSAAFADPESGLGGRVFTQSSVQTTESTIVVPAADPNMTIVNDNRILTGHRNGDIENR